MYVQMIVECERSKIGCCYPNGLLCFAEILDDSRLALPSRIVLCEYLSVKLFGHFSKNVLNKYLNSIELFICHKVIVSAV